MVAADTWKFLGLTVAAGYSTLGTWALLAPRNCAETLFLPRPSSPESLHSGDVERYSRLLGARDLSMAAAMLWFVRSDDWRAMGQMILAGTFLAAADSWAAWNAKGAALGLVLAAGSAFWSLIGYALVYWI
ncbi:hypothetical protein CcaverHIS002_0503320 [Cutaneotrichosporon cavernicola]|uniref:Uncharacterized protein n=1 Tax=Cutaneotrichosporon cavernicola TaxID=279322 RepID=A0AA48QWW3_9TREE|nr:uncharacterized protein CcaverHIS019_0503890 [Cutaneotrichosporon cavernicola]BEI84931.1 hypothetical protein CcaverHIS002_0503320 [Cutaneotrichosporon cavernicola]BEI92761.1 hypothetical protein CcaverHIS019_0503890 [Cutaneotrichosporon cavernicola]BEJ00538.1 hypothetical protein CcaverHIS631_0503950 [Cutaneotrichosporon cavernicola]BEJ08306.1 hypothetical protein CcaverHIS641_0503910 [Cutaneotrichosporon cavernicola]